MDELLELDARLEELRKLDAKLDELLELDAILDERGDKLLELVTLED
jgi:hypothetical protein